jgi:hypothetical protein
MEVRSGISSKEAAVLLYEIKKNLRGMMVSVLAYFA